MGDRTNVATRFPVAQGPRERQALKLFERIATPSEVEELKQYGGVSIAGEYATYVVLYNGQSYIVDEDWHILAVGCLVISESEILDDYGHCVTTYPVLDHFIANYLVLKNDERLYWNTAIMSIRKPEFVNPKDRINQEWAKKQQRKGVFAKIFG